MEQLIQMVFNFMVMVKCPMQITPQFHQDSIFAIGSNTKVITAILLDDMVEDGMLQVRRSYAKISSTGITIPQYKGHEITVGDLATHTSGLPEFPPTYCPTGFENAHSAQTPNDKIQTHAYLMNCPENYGFDQLYQGLSNTTISREPGSKVEYSTFGSSLTWRYFSVNFKLLFFLINF